MGGNNTVAMFGRVIQMSAVVACAVAACGGGKLGGDPPPGGLGGIMTSGGGATGQDGAAASGGAAGSGGDPRVSSGCILNDPATPVPFVDVMDPGPVAVACQGSAQSGTVIRIGDQSGQGFDWRASVLPSPGVFRPSTGVSSACPGFTPQDVGVFAAFPDDAAAWSRASATLAIDTTYAGLPRIEAQVNAILVPVQFSLELVGSTTVPPGTPTDPLVVNFGSGPGDVYVQVRNLGTAPLGLIRPASPPPFPFFFTDWGYHGEDPPPTPPVAPGEVATIHLGFNPPAPGDFTADLELTPFRTTPGAGCGSSVHVLLSGSGLPAP